MNCRKHRFRPSVLWDKDQAIKCALLAPDYVHTYENYLRIYVRSTGTIEHGVVICGHYVTFMSVGRQVNEGSKCIHLYESRSSSVHCEFEQL